MNDIDKEILEIINIVKRLKIFTIDDLMNEIVSKDNYYSQEIIEYVLFNHPNVCNSYGYFFWKDN